MRHPGVEGEPPMSEASDEPRNGESEALNATYT